MALDISIIDEPTVTVAAHRAVVPMSEIRGFYDGAYSAVARALGSSGGQIAGPALAWYARMPAETADVAAAFPVDGLEDGPLGDDVEVMEIVGGRAATLTLVGSYDGLPDAWGALMGWVADHGETARGDFTEIYLTEPDPDGDPEANQTRLVLPLA
ncbi:hypothetical protein GCM10025865_12250 [Paraoerskovia sediminicola]|uniref:AraC effector-binding domain-containing protein n=1 Tax=Paraoerskovia sediminicola TaxID=1138587 RepID=A0ABM8G1N0_9CELL|nr:GyrI-like domain-containing protein [Paraoerskovia sediminicola]BDZ41926.1 hypothetical protein GCM10025865_12250 [Paraoerskovia sediminicola]